MKPTSKLSKIWEILIFVLFLGVVFCFAYGFVFADAANAQLIAIYEVVDLGDSLNEVKKKITEMPQTWISSSSYPDAVILSTPLKIGATNWILRIQAENDIITCVKIHIEDSINYHPKGAPPDKGKCHYRWKDHKWVD